jgi:hypothetical protein
MRCPVQHPQDAATDGWYALLTSLDASITAAEVLLRYKGGPPAVAPMFLHSNRRIAALITVISLALLVFCLIEREAAATSPPKPKSRDCTTGSPPGPPAGSS